MSIVSIRPPIGQNIFQLAFANVFATIPVLMAMYVITPFKGITTINGNIIVELYISGNPNINGSLILNNDGIIASLPIVLICFDLLNNVRIASPNVAPLPPIAINVHQKGSVTIYGSAIAAVPAANAAWFAVKLFIKNVSNGPVITVS